MPLPDVDRAIVEAEYALTHLDADGIVLMSSYDAIYLGDPRFAAFFDAMHRLKATVFVHPTSPASVSCNIEGSPGKFNPLPLPNPFTEFFFDSTRTVFSLLLNDTLNRCPDMRMILSHAGSVLPPLIDRFQLVAGNAFFDGPPGSKQPLQQTVFERLYFDLAGAILPHQLPGLLRIADVNKFFFGSDWPWTPTPAAVKLAELFERSDFFDEETKKAIFSGRAWERK